MSVILHLGLGSFHRAHQAVSLQALHDASALMGESFMDPVNRKFAFDDVTDDVIPVLSPSPIDLGKYRDVVLDRFANTAIADTNQRVAMDGFSKVPGFIAPTFPERLAPNESSASVAMLPALFLAYLQVWHRGGIAYAHQDQAIDPAVAHAICEPADPVVAFWADARRVDAAPQASHCVAAFIQVVRH